MVEEKQLELAVETELPVRKGRVSEALEKARVATQFQKGVCPNPGGRPKTKLFRDALFKALARAADDPDFKPKTELEKVVANLLTIAKSSGKGAVHAIKEIIDRVDGKSVPSEEELDAKKQSGKIILVNSNKTEIKQ